MLGGPGVRARVAAAALVLALAPLAIAQVPPEDVTRPTPVEEPPELAGEEFELVAERTEPVGVSWTMVDLRWPAQEEAASYDAYVTDGESWWRIPVNATVEGGEASLRDEFPPWVDAWPDPLTYVVVARGPQGEVVAHGVTEVGPAADAVPGDDRLVEGAEEARPPMWETGNWWYAAGFGIVAVALVGVLLYVILNVGRRRD